MASMFSQLRLHPLFKGRASILAAAGLGSLVAFRIAQGAPIHLRAEPEAHATRTPKTFSSKLPQSLQLESSTVVNHNTKLLRFALPTEDAVSGLPLTSALLSITWPTGGMFPTLRPYTPVSSLDEPGHIDLLIKQYPSGKASTYLHALEPGARVLFWKVPRGYAWTPNQHPHILLIAGGAGITPIYQLARGILANPADKTQITVVFGVNTDADALFEREFGDWEKSFPGRFRVVYTVSRTEETSKFRKGQVSEGLLQEVLGGAGERPSKVFVCGPKGMEAMLVGGRGKSGILEKLGFGKEQVYKF